MAFSFPLTSAQFFGQLPIQANSFELTESLDISETGWGEQIVADIGPRLWKADLVIRPGTYAEIERVKSRLNLLRQAGRSCLFHPLPLLWPQHSTNEGADIESAPTQLEAVAVNNRDVTISGVPVGYKFGVGDFFGFRYGSDPVRYALHQIQNDRTVSGSGEVTFEVSPFIEPGYTLGAPVTFVKPLVKMVIVPGSTNVGSSRQMFTTGVKFSLIQTLR